MKFQFEVSNPEEKFLMEFEADIVEHNTNVRDVQYFLAKNYSEPKEKNGKKWNKAFSLEIINDVFIIIPYSNFKVGCLFPVF